MTTTHTSLNKQQEAVIADLDTQVQVLLDLMTSTRDRFTEAITEARETSPIEGEEVASILINSGGAFLHSIQQSVEAGMVLQSMWQVSMTWDGDMGELVAVPASHAVGSDGDRFPF